VSWRDDAANLPGLAPEEFDLNVDDTALVIVDMQYSDASREHGWGPSLHETHPAVWSYYFDRIENTVIPQVQRLLYAFRKAHGRIVYITLGPALPDGSDLIPNRRKMGGAIGALNNHVGTPEHRILAELEPEVGELVINKTSRGAFNSSAIDQVLRNFGTKAIVVVGVSTSSCVETTARDAADRGYNTVLVEDGTAELDEPSHEATLRQFAVRWGRVWTTNETLDHLGLAE